MKLRVLLNEINIIFVIFLLVFSCDFDQELNQADEDEAEIAPVFVKIEAEKFIESSGGLELESLMNGTVYLKSSSEGWMVFDHVVIPISGRYKTEIRVSSDTDKVINCWIEDCFEKTEGQYTRISELHVKNDSSEFETESKSVSFLKMGSHRMRLSFSDALNVDWIQFTLIPEG